MIAGLLGLLLALIFGVVGADLTLAEVFQCFPIGLFITIFSVTLLIKVAEGNDCFEKLAGTGILFCRHRRRALPFFVFAISALLSAGGIGNIATTALMAPAAFSIGRNIGLDPFLMTLMVVGGANASVMSPFSPTGLIANSLIAKVSETNPSFAEAGTSLFSYCFIWIGAVHLVGFFILGGARWIRAANIFEAQIVDVETPTPWNRAQLITMGILGLFFALNAVFGVEPFHRSLPTSIQVLGGEIGVLALFCLTLVATLRAGSLEQAARRVPWGLLMLICGMSTLISIIEKSTGFGGISRLAAHAGSEWALVLVVSVSSAVLSVFSSSSGVVMPLFLSMIPSLILGGFQGSQAWLITTIIVSSHLVDCSPFSTLGALSIAASKDGGVEARQLFGKLRAWGLSMIVVAAVTSTIAFVLVRRS